MQPSRSLPVFTAPVKVEEDVIAKDAILVDSSASGSHAAKSGAGIRMKLDTDGRLQPLLCSGSSRHFGSKSQFANRKAEPHPSRLLSKTKLEVNEATSTASKALPALTRTVSPIKQGGGRADYGYRFTDTTFAKNDWCPLDDGIEVTRPSASSDKAPSKEDVNAHIDAVLYGPSVKKRLPVFTEVCPE